jgi:hypothetical protein
MKPITNDILWGTAIFLMIAIIVMFGSVGAQFFYAMF